jgi:hypothetical protein
LDGWEQALEARDDLKVYGDNALGLFALALRYPIDDLHSAASESITDGSDDKKCDILHIDLEEGIAVVAQCYVSTKQKQSAPSNKASDLNTAVGWLLQRPFKDLPVRLRQSARELRDAIADNQIRHLHFWYIHNLPESAIVADELATVEATAKSALNDLANSLKIQISAQEVGKETLDEWYGDTLSPILVSDVISIDIPGGFEVTGDNWRAYVAPIPAKVLSALYRKHKSKLFSANVRDYLGSRRSDANIRNVIQFNNSQNKIAASDFRSTDRIQKKLKEQIAAIPEAEYEGGRRGGHSDVIKRSKRLLPSYTVGQALAAFHGDPVVAYNQKSNIWVSDRLYAKYFPEGITGAHVVFAYTLLRAVEENKKTLVAKYKAAPDSLTTQEDSLLEYFRHRGSTYLMVSAISSSLETILRHKIANRFRLSFGEKMSPEKGKGHWKAIIEVTSPFTVQLSEAFSDGLKNAEKVAAAQKTFGSLVQATAAANSTVFEKFRKVVTTSKK